MLVWIVVCGLALAALLYAEARKLRQARLIGAIAKPIASAAFVAAAITAGALQSRGGQSLFLALAWSFLGDVLLIPRARTAFLFGMAAFAMAHVGYAFLFDMRGVEWLWVVVGGLVMGVLGALVFLRLRPAIRQKAPNMVKPVIGYVAIITIMVAFAIGTVAFSWDALPLVAAIAFWLSDITVAVVRFGDGPIVWRIVGLPLYYAAQFMFVAMLPGAW